MTETLTVEEHTEAHGDKVKGYKKLQDHEIKAINQVKQVGVDLQDLMASLDSQGLDMDPRWRAMAITDLQVGLMKLTRAIAKPELF